jgi:hypothetical protein
MDNIWGKLIQNLDLKKSILLLNQSNAKIIAHNNIRPINPIKPLVFTNNNNEYNIEKIINDTIEYTIAKGKTGTSAELVVANS